MPRRTLSAAGVAVLALALLTVASVAPAKQPPPNQLGAGKTASGQDVVAGEVIVRFKEGASSSERGAARARADVSFDRSLLLARTQVVKVTMG